jgi:Flp pilus assembly protein TadB
MNFSNAAYRNTIQLILIRIAPLRLYVMRQNPGEFAPRTAPESDLQETLLGTALALGLFVVLFTVLVVPVVGVAALALLVVVGVARVGRHRLRLARVARRTRRVRHGLRKTRT